MAAGIIERMIRVLFKKKEPKTPREMKYFLKYGDPLWHQKCYPHKYTNSTGAR